MVLNKTKSSPMVSTSVRLVPGGGATTPALLSSQRVGAGGWDEGAKEESRERGVDRRPSEAGDVTGRADGEMVELRTW